MKSSSFMLGEEESLTGEDRDSEVEHVFVEGFPSLSEVKEDGGVGCDNEEGVRISPEECRVELIRSSTSDWATIGER